MQYRTRIAALAAVGGLVLAGCSATDQTDSPPAESTEAATHNAADVDFAQQMIPHHEQAVQMSKMAETRAESAEVRELAADIEAAQDPEIEQMSGWLKEWGEDVPTGMGMDHGSMDDGSEMGMMSDGDLDKLMDASGAGFDRMFLTMMIAHHEGAIRMAKDEQGNGKDARAIKLAEAIESAQTAEIALMRDLLKQ